MLRIILILPMLCLACAAQKPLKNQGIIGEVRWMEGNLMPTIGDTTYSDRAKGIAVQREIYIYEATKMEDQQDGQGVFFHDINARFVKKLKTDKQGKFEVALPTGKYSLFVKEEEGLFANTFDGDGNINPVEVKEAEFLDITIVVNYKAYY